MSFFWRTACLYTPPYRALAATFILAGRHGQAHFFVFHPLQRGSAVTSVSLQASTLLALGADFAGGDALIQRVAKGYEWILFMLCLLILSIINQVL